MTGGRPGRDPRIAGRRERGPTRGDGPPEEPRWSGTGGAELEELHVAVVASRGARVGIRTALAGVALVGLLAVGFGAFGGRPQPSSMPVWTPVAEASGRRAPTPEVELTGEERPRVTPFAPCAVERNVVPTVTLEVGGVGYPGAIEVLAANPDALPPDAPTAQPPATVLVATEDPTAIVVRGDRCALAWVIDFDATTTFDVVANGTMDPGRSAQNRFEVPLVEFPGRDSLLRAQLLFPGFNVRASWRVQVAALEHPVPALHWSDGDMTTPYEGCFVAVQLANGWREPTRPCESSGAFVLAKPFIGETGFRFTLAGWEASVTGISCGHGIDERFVPYESGCGWTSDASGVVEFVELPPTAENEEWTLAIDACAINGPILDATLCGTWYANVVGP